MARIDDLYDFSRKVATLPHVVRVESLVDGDPPLDKDDYESILIHPSPMSEAAVTAGKKLMVGEHAMLLYVVADSPPRPRKRKGSSMRYGPSARSATGRCWWEGRRPTTWTPPSSSGRELRAS